LARRNTTLLNKFLNEIQQLRTLSQKQLAREYAGVGTALEKRYADMLRQIDVELANGNLTLKNIRGVVEGDLNSLRENITNTARTLQESGVESGVRLGVNAVQRGGVNVQFNRPLLDAILRGIEYVDSEAFREAVESFGIFHDRVVADILATGLANGRGASGILADIRRYLGTTVDADMKRLVRTTHNYAYRQGTRALYERTGVETWIWLANLGNPRTCLGCVGQHGTRHPVSEVLNDHHNGRCAMAPVTPTWAELGFKGGREPIYETGVDWIAKQDGETQQALLGKQLYEWYQSGQVVITPETVSTTYENPIFGEMRRRATNAETLSRSQELVRN
jgi:hypothetical protein